MYKIFAYISFFFAALTLSGVSNAMTGSGGITVLDGVVGDARTVVCDGTADQVEINDAITSASTDRGTVHLEKSGTTKCVLSAPIVLKAKVSLECAPGLELQANFDPASDTGMVIADNTASSTLDDMSIKGCTFDMNDKGSSTYIFSAIYMDGTGIGDDGATVAADTQNVISNLTVSDVKVYNTSTTTDHKIQGLRVNCGAPAINSQEICLNATNVNVQFDGTCAAASDSTSCKTDAHCVTTTYSNNYCPSDSPASTTGIIVTSGWGSVNISDSTVNRSTVEGISVNAVNRVDVSGNQVIGGSDSRGYPGYHAYKTSYGGLDLPIKDSAKLYVGNSFTSVTKQDTALKDGNDAVFKDITAYYNEPNGAIYSENSHKIFGKGSIGYTLGGSSAIKDCVGGAADDSHTELGSAASAGASAITLKSTGGIVVGMVLWIGPVSQSYYGTVNPSTGVVNDGQFVKVNSINVATATIDITPSILYNFPINTLVGAHVSMGRHINPQQYHELAGGGVSSWQQVQGCSLSQGRWGISTLPETSLSNNNINVRVQDNQILGAPNGIQMETGWHLTGNTVNWSVPKRIKNPKYDTFLCVSSSGTSACIAGTSKAGQSCTDDDECPYNNPPGPIINLGKPESGICTTHSTVVGNNIHSSYNTDALMAGPASGVFKCQGFCYNGDIASSTECASNSGCPTTAPTCKFGGSYPAHVCTPTPSFNKCVNNYCGVTSSNYGELCGNIESACVAHPACTGGNSACKKTYTVCQLATITGNAFGSGGKVDLDFSSDTTTTGLTPYSSSTNTTGVYPTTYSGVTVTSNWFTSKHAINFPSEPGTNQFKNISIGLNSNVGESISTDLIHNWSDSYGLISTEGPLSCPYGQGLKRSEDGLTWECDNNYSVVCNGGDDSTTTTVLQGGASTIEVNSLEGFAAGDIITVADSPFLNTPETEYTVTSIDTSNSKLNINRLLLITGSGKKVTNRTTDRSRINAAIEAASLTGGTVTLRSRNREGVAADCMLDSAIEMRSNVKLTCEEGFSIKPNSDFSTIENPLYSYANSTWTRHATNDGTALIQRYRPLNTYDIEVSGCKLDTGNVKGTGVCDTENSNKCVGGSSDGTSCTDSNSCHPNILGGVYLDRAAEMQSVAAMTATGDITLKDLTIRTNPTGMVSGVGTGVSVDCSAASTDNCLKAINIDQRMTDTCPLGTCNTTTGGTCTNTDTCTCQGGTRDGETCSAAGGYFQIKGLVSSGMRGYCDTPDYNDITSAISCDVKNNCWQTVDIVTPCMITTQGDLATEVYDSKFTVGFSGGIKVSNKSSIVDGNIVVGVALPDGGIVTDGFNARVSNNFVKSTSIVSTFSSYAYRDFVATRGAEAVPDQSNFVYGPRPVQWFNNSHELGGTLLTNTDTVGYRVGSAGSSISGCKGVLPLADTLDDLGGWVSTNKYNEGANASHVEVLAAPPSTSTSNLPEAGNNSISDCDFNGGFFGISASGNGISNVNIDGNTFTNVIRLAEVGDGWSVTGNTFSFNDWQKSGSGSYPNMPGFAPILLGNNIIGPDANGICASDVTITGNNFSVKQSSSIVEASKIGWTCSDTTDACTPVTSPAAACIVTGIGSFGTGVIKGTCNSQSIETFKTCSSAIPTDCTVRTACTTGSTCTQDLCENITITGNSFNFNSTTTATDMAIIDMGGQYNYPQAPESRNISITGNTFSNNAANKNMGILRLAAAPETTTSISGIEFGLNSIKPNGNSVPNVIIKGWLPTYGTALDYEYSPDGLSQFGYSSDDFYFNGACADSRCVALGGNCTNTDTCTLGLNSGLGGGDSKMLSAEISVRNLEVASTKTIKIADNIVELAANCGLSWGQNLIIKSTGKVDISGTIDVIGRGSCTAGSPGLTFFGTVSPYGHPGNKGTGTTASAGGSAGVVDTPAGGGGGNAFKCSASNNTCLLTSAPFEGVALNGFYSLFGGAGAKSRVGASVATADAIQGAGSWVTSLGGAGGGNAYCECDGSACPANMQGSRGGGGVFISAVGDIAITGLINTRGAAGGDKDNATGGGGSIILQTLSGTISHDPDAFDTRGGEQTNTDNDCVKASAAIQSGLGGYGAVIEIDLDG